MMPARGLFFFRPRVCSGDIPARKASSAVRTRGCVEAVRRRAAGLCRDVEGLSAGGSPGVGAAAGRRLCRMSDNLPQQPPRVQMRIGDAERDAVLGVLQNAYGEGQLTLEEFDERQQNCLRARYIDDLSALVVDLPGGAGWHHAVTRPANPASAPVATRGAAVRNEIAFMSGKVIHLDARTPAVTSFALWGGNEIRTEAVMGPGVEIELSLSSIMGGHSVYVPERVRVIDQSVNIMAGVDVSEKADGDGSNGTLIIKGFNFWGGTSVLLREKGR